MINIFGKQNKWKSDLKFVDINGLPLSEGDEVISLRYDLGKCIIRQTKDGLTYESIETGLQVNWIKMVDAATKYQKVIKID